MTIRNDSFAFWVSVPWCVWEIAAAAVGFATPDEHETAIDQASAVGTGHFHECIFHLPRATYLTGSVPDRLANTRM